MGAVLILTPIVISSWPAITVAVAGAASALGFTLRKAAQEVMQKEKVDEEVRSVEMEMANSEVLAQNLATDQSVVLTKGAVQLRVERDARGQCKVCATGKGLSQAELRQTAEQFTQKLTQCFIYDKVLKELKGKNFQVVNEEVMQDEGIRIHVRRWVD